MEVCEFIGEKYTSAMLNYSETNSPVINRSGWAEEFLQATLTLQPAIKTNVEKWQSNLSPVQIAVVDTTWKVNALERG